MLTKITFYLLAVLSFAAAKAMPPPLNQKKIHASYTDGDFEITSNELEAYARTYKDREWLREDSVFLYKHLAVIYSARPATLEKGKYYMVSMLRIMPSAEILDMYVSEEVDRIFLRTRQEFLANMRMFGVDTTGLKIPTSTQSGKNGMNSNLANQKNAGAQPANGKGSSAQIKNSDSHWGWWTAGGLFVAAAGAATYYVLQADGGNENVNVIDVPAKK